MAPFADPGVLSVRDFLLLAALGAGQIALGLILFTAGARLIPAAQAGLITLLEIVLGPLWVWLIYSEQPDAVTLAGGAVIMSAVLLHAISRSAARPARSAPGHVVRAGRVWRPNGTRAVCQLDLANQAPTARAPRPVRRTNSSGVVRVVSVLLSGTHDVSHLDNRHAPATARHIAGAGRHGTLTT